MGCNQGNLSSTCRVMEFLLYGDFAVPLLGISVGIGHLQGSSMAKNNKVEVVTTVPSVAEGLKNVMVLTSTIKTKQVPKKQLKKKN